MDLYSENIQIVRIGTFIEIEGICLESGKSHKTYEIVTHHLTVDESGVQCKTDIQPVTDEGDDLDEPVITVNLDNYDYKCV
jgi:myo-inositol-hexaphosphate 3-phosphohydrolase